MGAWHFAFVLPVTTISARGANRGIEVANRVRAPVVLVLCLLAAYAPWTGDGRGGLTFAFAPDFGAISPAVVLAAIGQAFYATGVGNGTSLVRSALIISGSTLVVSLLATVMT
jgi:NSS family neurotransmitter:Na+ symporter